MSVPHPFHRMYRRMKAHSNSGYSSWAYIRDKEFAREPAHYVRAFMLIQSDLQKLFEYIEPSEEALNAYSYRTHELLMRTCIEVEANFKAILSENIYTPEVMHSGKSKLDMGVYQLVNKTHHLSSYQVSLPIWNGEPKLFAPFKQWETPNTQLIWYSAYNSSKHDRHAEFKKASFGNLLDAVCGLLVLLSSQFGTQDFSPGSVSLGIEGYDYYDHTAAIGDFFRIQFPDDWTDDEIYEFDWSKIKDQSDRIKKFNYDHLKSPPQKKRSKKRFNHA